MKADKKKIMDLMASQCLVNYPSKEHEEQFLLVDQQQYMLVKDLDSDQFTDLTQSTLSQANPGTVKINGNLPVVSSPAKLVGLQSLMPEETKETADRGQQRTQAISFEEINLDDQTKQEALIVHNHMEGKTQSFQQFKVVQEQKVKVLMTEEFRIIDDNYIQNSKQQSESKESPDWFSLYNQQQFNFRENQALLNQIKKAIIEKRQLSPDTSSVPDQLQFKKQLLERQSAWCVLLGIRHTSQEFKNFESMYKDILINFKPTDKAEQDTLRQIKLDVDRTFKSYNLKSFNADINSGENKLYNLLKVYSLILDPVVGYTQGMNFIAAIILMHVPNEVLACQIFMKVLSQDNWARIFINSTPKLFDLSQRILERLEIGNSELYEHLVREEICLEVLLASPLMTLFANTLSFAESTHVLNMFILEGECMIVDLILNIYKNMTPDILAKKDQFEIQAYMSKTIYDQAMAEGKFYPKF